MNTNPPDALRSDQSPKPWRDTEEPEQHGRCHCCRRLKDVTATAQGLVQVSHRLLAENKDLIRERVILLGRES